MFGVIISIVAIGVYTLNNMKDSLLNLVVTRHGEFTHQKESERFCRYPSDLSMFGVIISIVAIGVHTL